MFDEKPDRVKFDDKVTTYVTNFSKIELDMFKNNENDEEEDEEDDEEYNEEVNNNSRHKVEAPQYLNLESGLKLRIKSATSLLSSSVEEENNQMWNQLVFVETARRNLNKLVMSIITDSCILVEGELSTGKTVLIESLAHKTNNKLIKYQMDEFMDSKVIKEMLFGERFERSLLIFLF